MRRIDLLPAELAQAAQLAVVLLLSFQGEIELCYFVLQHGNCAFEFLTVFALHVDIFVLFGSVLLR